MIKRTLIGALRTLTLIAVAGVWLMAAPQITTNQIPPAGNRERTFAVATPVPTIGLVDIRPDLLTAGIPTTITVTAQILSTFTLPVTVNLLRLSTAGTRTITLGGLHDDGLNGDVSAKDGIYTIQVTLQEPLPGEVRLRVSAGFPGSVARATSPVQSIAVVAPVSGLTVYQNAFYNFSYPSGYNLSSVKLVTAHAINNRGLDSFGLTNLIFVHSSSDAVTSIIISSTPNWRNETPDAARARVYDSLVTDLQAGDTLETFNINGQVALREFYPWYSQTDSSRLGSREVTIFTEQRTYSIQMIWSGSATNSMSSPIQNDFQTIVDSFAIH